MPKKEAETEQAEEVRGPRPSVPQLVRLCLAAWLVPGLGHLLLGRKWRAVILFAAILAMFFLGIAMQGEFYRTGTGSYLEALGHYGELCVGVAMPAARFFGYGGGNPFFVSSDYGSAFLVAAGMLNVLSIFDAFDIAMGRKP